MNKFLLPIYSLLICLLFSQVSYAQSSSSCVKTDKCFEFTYLPIERTNGNVKISFAVKVNCESDISNVAFEMPAGVRASTYSPASGVTVENGTNNNGTDNPFYAIKFNTNNNFAYKGGNSKTFSYTIPAAAFDAMNSMRVQAKAGQIVGEISLNPKDCSSTTTPGGNTDVGNTGGNKGGDNTGGNPTGNCSTSQPAITGEQHPCPGDIEIYSIVNNDRNYTNIVWDVPRAHAGEPPVGWEILSYSDDKSSVTVRVGMKSGTMKVKVTDPVCGTKVATLPVKPGKGYNVNVAGPGTVCTNVQQVYTASVSKMNGNGNNNNGNGNVKGEFYFVWSVPADWTIVSGQGTAELTVKPGVEEGDVSVFLETEDTQVGNGNNGKGVGGIKAICDGGSATMPVMIGEDCGQVVCPTITATIAGPDSVCAFGDEPVTYTANVENGTGAVMFAWSFPSDWTVVSEDPTTNTIQVLIGFESGPVTVVATSECGATATTMLDVLALEDCSGLTPLPVELISFTGEATKSGVLLEWATASEQNNDRFEVERSADGKAFSKVAEVKGSGTTTARQTYSMRDTKAGRGTHYYRLRQVDVDGSFDYSKVIAVDNNMAAATATLLVAPNPVTDGEFTIALDATQPAQLQIMDMNGRLLHSQQLSQGTREVTLNAQSMNMRSGLYIISVKSAAATNHTKVVVR